VGVEVGAPKSRKTTRKEKEKRGKGLMYWRPTSSVKERTR
jgi:hypothetical protein